MSDVTFFGYWNNAKLIGGQTEAISPAPGLALGRIYPVDPVDPVKYTPT